MLLYAGNKSKGMVKDMRDYCTYQKKCYMKYQKLGHLVEYLDSLASCRPSWCGHACPAGTFILLKNGEDYASSVREIRAELGLYGYMTIEQQIKERAEFALFCRRRDAEIARLAAEHPAQYDSAGRRIRVKRVR